jgi:hypothetical protein
MMINPDRLPGFRSILPFSLWLAGAGWLGVILLVFATLPTLGPRWLFFFFLVLALTGTFLPVVFFLNLRFPSIPAIGFSVIVRQACWVGVYGGLVAWLQLGRVLNTGLGVGLAAGFIGLEWLIRFREKNKAKSARPFRYQTQSQVVDEEDADEEE